MQPLQGGGVRGQFFGTRNTFVFVNEPLSRGFPMRCGLPNAIEQDLTRNVRREPADTSLDHASLRAINPPNQSVRPASRLPVRQHQPPASGNSVVVSSLA